MRSMTGYGRAESRFYRDEMGHVTVEIRSSNHRYLNVALRIPEALSSYADEIEKTVRKEISRGSVQYALRIVGGTQAHDVTFDQKLLEKYYRDLRNLAKRLGLKEEIRLESLALLPGVVTLSPLEKRANALWPLIRRLSRNALKALVVMRTREGESLKKDIQARLTNIGSLLVKVKRRAPAAIGEYRRRLVERLRGLLASEGLVGASGKLNDADIVKEMTVFAERSDIAEEIARLESHLAQLRVLAEGGGPAGRKLDFLAQEMHREASTMAAKCLDAPTGSLILDLKVEIDRIREQAMNVE